MFELEQKGYFYLLFIIPVMIALFVYVQYWKIKAQKNFGDLELIKKLSPEQSLFKPVLKFCLLLLALFLLIIALVNPMMGTKLEKVKREGIDIVFAVDVSKSMLAEDIAPNRLEKSKQLVSQIINNLASDRIGIIAYSGSAFPVLPITTDYSVAKMFLQGMNPEIISAQGTSIDEAILLASTNFFDKKDKSKKVLVILSDGEDHSENAVSAAKEAKEKGIKIITIGVGTENGGPIPLKKYDLTDGFQRDKDGNVVNTKRNATVLLEIAKTANGGYVDGNSTKNVVDYLKKSLENIEKTEFESTQMTNFQSQFQWFVALAFFLLFIELFMFNKKTNWIRKLNLFNEKE